MTEGHQQEQEKKLIEGGYHDDCPRCHGSGECSNGQFHCMCRWHRVGCALVHGRADCDCELAPHRHTVSESHQQEKPWCQICGVELTGFYCETCQRTLSESHPSDRLRELIEQFKEWRDAPMVDGRQDEIRAIRSTLNVVVCELEPLLLVRASQPSEGKRWTEVLCTKCGGNGVIKIPGGMSECPHCEGRCYEPAPPSFVRVIAETTREGRKTDDPHEYLKGVIEEDLSRVETGATTPGTGSTAKTTNGDK